MVCRTRVNHPSCVLPQICVKPKKSTVPQPPRRSLLGREAAELDQTGLVGVQRQAELRQPLPQIAEKPLGIRLPLEADDGVVGVADDNHLAGRQALAPLVRPEVVDVVQVGGACLAHDRHRAHGFHDRCKAGTGRSLDEPFAT
jgi:hypothetical protein